MADRLNCFDGGTLAGDSANTANAYVKRANDGSISVGVANSAGVNNVGAVSQSGLAVTTSATLTVASAAFQEVDATAGAVVLTLPPVATAAGQEFICTKVDSSGNAAGFKGSGSELINGSNTNNTSTQYVTIRIRANQAGTKWLTW